MKLPRPMPAFRHVCNPCPECSSGDPNCPTCWGQSDTGECRCEEFYGREVDLRINEVMGK